MIVINWLKLRIRDHLIML
uniref:Uncharacterized protein n=1 Tax=Arundo donax TaxID=35708 RepID=A0A0A9BF21_ARUDO